MSAIKVGLRAANLALINIMPLYLRPHLSFLADLFSISLKSFRIVYRLAGIMSFVLVLLHIFVVIACGIGGFSLRVPENLYGVVVSLQFFYNYNANLEYPIGRVSFASLNPPLDPNPPQTVIRALSPHTLSFSGAVNIRHNTASYVNISLPIALRIYLCGYSLYIAGLPIWLRGLSESDLETRVSSSLHHSL